MVDPKDGDRIQEDHGERTVITPLSKDNPHNFGPASARDIVVNTCERPGGEMKGQKIPTTEVVQKWIQFMSLPERNIKHVIILLSVSELEAYDEPGLVTAYEAGGITVHHVPYNSEKSYRKIMSILDSVFEKGENVVAHCTHGMGRSGRITAGWLVHKYGLSIEEAVEETLQAARAHGVERMGSPRQLTDWIAESKE